MSTTERRTLHVNSLAAYQSGKLDLFSKREIEILGALRKLKMATDREVMVALEFSDMNAVRPRLTELIKDGVIEERGTCPDAVTGKKVRIVGFANNAPKAQTTFPFAIEIQRQ